MLEIVGVRFRNAGKVYYFDPDGLTLEEGDQVILETSRGMECGDIVIANKHIPEKETKQELKKIIRLATNDDLKQLKENREMEEYALKVCEEKVTNHDLDMKLIKAEYTFDRNKVLIYFTSDGRVDFRQLVRDLASVLRTRIELRQIGVRDEAKMLGGLGMCGRPFCCSTFLNDFDPVSIKMAKCQGLSLNPSKISGVCGRLMCCLKYEQDAYEYLIDNTPKEGTVVQTSSGIGEIVEVSLLTGNLKIQFKDSNGMSVFETFHKDDVKLVKVPKGKSKNSN